MSKAFQIDGDSAVQSHTSIEFLLDETGSMSSTVDTTISSFNEFLLSQRNQVTDNDKCSFTLTKFDSTGINALYQDLDILQVPDLNRETYKPNAMTNLYDAIGTRINAVKAKVSQSPTTSQLFVIMTDGHDNQSREYTADSVKVLIKEAEALGWTFVFLGANQDAWQVGQTFGMSAGNTMTYDMNNIKGAMGTLASATSSYRSMRASGVVGNAESSKDFFSGDKK